MASNTGHDRHHTEEHSPPVFKRWRGWYFLVIGALVTYIIILYLFTNLF